MDIQSACPSRCPQGIGMESAAGAQLHVYKQSTGTQKLLLKRSARPLLHLGSKRLLCTLQLGHLLLQSLRQIKLWKREFTYPPAVKHKPLGIDTYVRKEHFGQSGSNRCRYTPYLTLMDKVSSHEEQGPVKASRSIGFFRGLEQFL